MRRSSLAACASAAVLAACSDGGATDAETAAAFTECADLAALALPDTTVTAAEVVPAGGFSHPLAAGALTPNTPPPDFTGLPEFCRVAATVSPTPGSTIGFELWMPTENWNGKFVGAGNGGFWGAIRYAALIDPLARGFAVAGTDHGHTGGGSDTSFAADPDQLTDFAWRAAHEMTVTSKALIDAHYGAGPRLSYWSGCTSGGRQGVDEAQRFPEDYDAIVAGAPTNNLAALQAYSIVIEQIMTDPEGGFPVSKLALLKAGALAACDLGDGVADGVIGDPLACAFDPAALQCERGDAETCLTPRQVDQARAIRAGVVGAAGERYYPGVEPSSEDGLGIFGSTFSMGGGFWRNVVFADPDWDVWSFDVDADVARGRAAHDGVLESNEANLSPFLERGGKLLLWHGWTDPLVLPRNTIDYHERVVAAVGEPRAEQGVRLFMAPGVDHCGGGDGPNQIDWLAALDAWAETGEPPATILARRPLSDGGTRSRPLCPHPLVARYNGDGDTDDAANFTCTE
jgi:feruloyl esterase